LSRSPRSSVRTEVESPPTKLNLDILQDDPSTIYVLSNDLRITFVNSAWDRFAAENGAGWSVGEWGPGRLVLDAIPDVLRPFYQRLFARARETGEVVEHDYECSSATEDRLFRMRILPSANALVVVNSLVRVAPQLATAAPDILSMYQDEHGLIVQCSHCRRVRVAHDNARWEWVPSYVEQASPRTSHGLCKLCFEYYYPEPDATNEDP
jgi:hypothetical protein